MILDKILFFDDRIDFLFDHSKNKKQLIDYFDIEVQKILRQLGYSFKRNPEFILSKSSTQNQFDYICDLNSFDFSRHHKELHKMPCCGIIFDCYL